MRVKSRCLKMYLFSVSSKTISKDRKMLLQDGTGAGGMGGKWGQESKVTKEPAN